MCAGQNVELRETSHVSNPTIDKIYSKNISLNLEKVEKFIANSICGKFVSLHLANIKYKIDIYRKIIIDECRMNMLYSCGIMNYFT